MMTMFTLGKTGLAVNFENLNIRPIMDSNELTDIEERLRADIIKTEGIIEEYKGMTVPVAPDVAIGRISRMDAINNKSVTEAAQRQAEQRLKNLKAVLLKLGTPEFGICARCRKQIPTARILFRPESLKCVNCAQ